MSTLPDPEGRKLLRIEVRNSQTPIEKKPRVDSHDREGRRELPGHALALACEGPAHGVRRGRLPQHLRVLAGPRSDLPARRRLCTRRCDFCDIATGRPTEYDKDEPRRIAESVRDLDLRYVTITGVTRDDLPDGAACCMPRRAV